MDALTLVDLRRRAGPNLLSNPQRVDFHHLLLAHKGTARHMVDFVEHELEPGSVLLVHPGQVQQWRIREGFEGQLALISSEALAPSVARSDVVMRMLALPEWPVVSKPSQRLFTEAVADMTRLSADVHRFEGTDLEAGIIRHELLTLLLRLARELRAVRPARESTREADVHALFAKELEVGYAKRLSVIDYANRLGFSESTLSRACVATVGRTAKEEIDRRAALEAKRLLVHSQATAAHIGHQLGFTEPTNFVKFFRRNVGCTPLEFREQHIRPEQ
ncbi:MAG: AraC family transcriptional regulator [Proteobacteria bacterium]|nr:AraC family transcriptional regulator [Pseudomonadota bacterium]